MGNTFTDTYGGNTYTATHGGNTFSNTYGSAVPSGGGSAAHHASSGGSTFLGGLFGDVAHAVEHVVHPIAPVVHTFNNDILQPASKLGEGFVMGLAEMGKLAGEDFYNTWRHPSLHPTKNNSHFYNQIVVPQAKDVSNKFAPIGEHPLRGSSYSAVRRDPFGTALDLLALGTIPFGAEGAALKGATLADRAGLADTVIGRGLARAAVRANEARKPYDVTYAPNEAEGGVFKADRARTVQGRYVYNPVREAVGRAFKGSIPYVGNAARFNRYADQMTAIDLGPDYALLRAFDHAIGANIRSSKRLTAAERVTLDIIPGYGPDTARAAELGVPRQQLLDFYQKKLALTRQTLERENLGRGARSAAKVEERAISGKIKTLARYAAEIDEAIKNPRPILQQVTEQARGVADKIGTWIIDAHLATPETVAERPFLEQKLLTGAEYSKGKDLGYEQLQPNYAAKRAGYNAAVAEHEALAGKLEAPIAEPAPIPEAVKAEAEPTFLMDINKTFYDSHVAKGGGGEVTRPSFFTRGGVQLTRVRLTADQLRSLEADARHENSSSARAALRRIEAQRGRVHEAIDKSARKLRFTKDKVTGGYTVEGSQYHIFPEPQTGGWIAVHGDTPLSGGAIHRELADAKAAVEKDAAYHRSEALQAQRRAATAPGDPFMEALGEYTQAVTAQDVLETKDHVTAEQVAAAKQRVDEAAAQLATARMRVGAKRRIKQESGFYGGSINFDQIPLEHPDAFYRPHAGPQVAGKGGFEPSANVGVSAPKKPGETKLNTGHRFSTGQLESGPQVWTRAGLHVMKFRAIQQTLERYRPVMVPYDGVGGSAPLREGYGPVNIKAAEHGYVPSSISRGQKESAALDENLLSLTPAKEHAQVAAELDALFPAEHKNLQVATFQMPLRDIRKIKGDYKRANIVVRNLIDKPLAVWKALVLKNRPAWLVNNLFGQHALLLLHNGFQFQNYMEALKPNQRKEINDHMQGLLMQGTSNLVTGAARFGKGEGPMSAGYYGRGPQAVALAGKGAGRVLNAWGDSIAKLNQEFADNVPRTALAVRYLKEKKQAMRHLEIAHGAVASAVKGKSLPEVAAMLSQDDKAEILRKVNRYLGDFNSMSGASARRVRRVIPFATWFKVIMQISADLTLDHPEKLLFVKALEQAAQKDPGLAPDMKLLPSWYQGSFNAPFAGGPAVPGTTPLLSTTAINPFMTPVQLSQQVSALFKTGTPSASDNPVASLGPLAEIIDLSQGVDPFTGQAYQGPGAKQSPAVRTLAGLVFGLPETRLLQQGGIAPYYQPPKSYHDTYVDVHGHKVPLDAIMRYLGYPIRRIDNAASARYAREGR